MRECRKREANAAWSAAGRSNKRSRSSDAETRQTQTPTPSRAQHLPHDILNLILDALIELRVQDLPRFEETQIFPVAREFNCYPTYGLLDLARTCKSWLPVVRGRLYRCIRLTEPGAVQKLLAAAKKNPSLVVPVKRLDVSPLLKNPVRRGKDLICEILPLLVNLDGLCLNTDQMQYTSRHLYSPSSELKTLHVYARDDAVLWLPDDSLDLDLTLEHLALVGFYRGGVRQLPFPNLESLSLSASTIRWDKTMSTFRKMTRLKVLDIQQCRFRPSLSPAKGDPLVSILEVLGSQIEYLRLHCRAYDMPLHKYLPLCTNLKKFSIDGTSDILGTAYSILGQQRFLQTVQYLRIVDITGYSAAMARLLFTICGDADCMASLKALPLVTWRFHFAPEAPEDRDSLLDLQAAQSEALAALRKRPNVNVDRDLETLCSPDSIWTGGLLQDTIDEAEEYPSSYTDEDDQFGDTSDSEDEGSDI